MLGVYDLRKLAREIGVHSPTTKRKNVLISEIEDIQSGKTSPAAKNKRGRPAK